MAINLEAIRAQQRELHKAADDAERVRRKIIVHREELYSAWRSKEEKSVDKTLEEIERNIAKIAKNMEDIGRRILITAEEIETEEAAKQAGGI